MVSKDDIASWRGGYPDRCDWCDFPCPPSFLEPEESSMLVCRYCLWEWDTMAIAGALTEIYGKPKRGGE